MLVQLLVVITISWSTILCKHNDIEIILVQYQDHIGTPYMVHTCKIFGAISQPILNINYLRHHVFLFSDDHILKRFFIVYELRHPLSTLVVFGAPSALYTFWRYFYPSRVCSRASRFTFFYYWVWPSVIIFFISFYCFSPDQIFFWFLMTLYLKRHPTLISHLLLFIQVHHQFLKWSIWYLYFFWIITFEPCLQVFFLCLFMSIMIPFNTSC